jgi:hypothetical protein
MNGQYDTEEEAEAAAIAYVNLNGPIEFDGMNCNDYLDDDQPECSGWYGEDRRCECGNRRVYWRTDMINGKYTVVATAY